MRLTAYIASPAACNRAIVVFLVDFAEGPSDPVIQATVSSRMLRFGIALLWLIALGVAHAHTPGLSTAAVSIHPDRLEATLVFSTADAGTLVELDRNQDGQMAKAELAAAATALQEMGAQALQVKCDDRWVKPSSVRCTFDASNNATVFLSFPTGEFSQLLVTSAWLARMPPGHRQFLSLQDPKGNVLTERLLSADHCSVTVRADNLNPKPTPPPPPANTFADFLMLGIRHIWTGYDHLLFLFGLLMVTRNFLSALQIITCFTIAHSITLAVATLSLVQIPSRVVEPLIAASIVYVGIENLVRGDDPKGRWLLAFGFGLIHGFGFAAVLRELGVGAHGSAITMPLLSFNLGVEVGQIAIAAVALPVIWKLQSWPGFARRWVPALSVAIAAVGGYWFVVRCWPG